MAPCPDLAPALGTLDGAFWLLLRLLHKTENSLNAQMDHVLLRNPSTHPKFRGHGLRTTNASREGVYPTPSAAGSQYELGKFGAAEGTCTGKFCSMRSF